MSTEPQPVAIDSIEAKLLATLGPIDEIEQALLARQQELAGQLAEVEADLTRIAGVREAIASPNGRPGRKKAKAKNGVAQRPGAENREKIVTALRRLGEATVTEVAEATGLQVDRTRRNMYALVNEGTLAVAREGAGPHPSSYKLS